jgi:hypothetical protein
MHRTLLFDVVGPHDNLSVILFSFSISGGKQKYKNIIHA